MARSLFDGQVPLILDGGKSKYGKQSTIIDCTGKVPTIVNYGAVSYDYLRLILPEIELPSHLRK
jgi:tRNA A37 threonylcarbamoyladenosine synthetase subunit TsaC/SUA5/YrdC